LSANVTSVVATKAAFAALKKDGSVWAWGNSNYGGSIDDNIRRLLSNGTMVLQGNDMAFLAINSQGRVMGWGNKAVFNEAGVVGSIPITSTNRVKFSF
jgi:serralysin